MSPASSRLNISLRLAVLAALLAAGSVPAQNLAPPVESAAASAAGAAQTLTLDAVAPEPAPAVESDPVVAATATVDDATVAVPADAAGQPSAEPPAAQVAEAALPPAASAVRPAAELPNDPPTAPAAAERAPTDEPATAANPATKDVTIPPASERAAQPGPGAAQAEAAADVGLGGAPLAAEAASPIAVPAQPAPLVSAEPVPFAADADAPAPGREDATGSALATPAVMAASDTPPGALAVQAAAPTPADPTAATHSTSGAGAAGGVGTTPLPPMARARTEALAPATAAEAATAATTDPLAATLAPTPSAPPEMGPPALIADGDPTSPSFIGPPLVPPMKLLEEEVAPGSKRQLMWSAGSSFAGGDSVAPVNVVRGTRPGPVLCLTAAIHGDELNGVEIVRRILNSVNPDRLSGTVIAVPIVNMFGFTRSSRYLPDRRDLNRFFPGSQRGSIASRIAHSFFNEVARHCDYLVDFHTGSFERDNLPQVRADLRLPEVLRFARGFGALPVLHSDGSRGMLRVAATQVGIPSVTFEVGAPGVLQVAQIDAAAEAIDALAHHLGMVPDAPPPQDPQAIFYESQWVRSNAGGLLISQVELGEPVEPGQCLGVVVDPVRNVERRIEAPIHGRVIGMARNQVVLPGFAAFHIGEATSAERASDAAASGQVEEVVEEDPDPAMEREPSP